MLSNLRETLSARLDDSISALPFRLNNFWKSAIKVFVLATALSLPIILLVLFLVPSHHGTGSDGGKHSPRPPAAYEPLPPFDGTIDFGGETGRFKLNCTTDDVFGSMWMYIHSRFGPDDDMRDMYKFWPLRLDVEGSEGSGEGEGGGDREGDGDDEVLGLSSSSGRGSNDTDVEKVQMVYFAARLFISQQPKSYTLWQFQENARNSQQNPIIPLSLDVEIPPSRRSSSSSSPDVYNAAAANADANAELVLTYLPLETRDRRVAWRHPIRLTDYEGVTEYTIGVGMNVTGVGSESGYGQGQGQGHGRGGEVRVWFEGEEQVLSGDVADGGEEDGRKGEGEGKEKGLRVHFFRRRRDEPGSGPYSGESVLFDSLPEPIGFGGEWGDVRRILED